MRFRFRGTRGSLPAPGPDTVRYGGNTSCIEVRSDDGELIILDAGTGIRELGRELSTTSTVTCHIFITHTHWDHIHGLPYFLPLYGPGNGVTIYGPPDPVAMSGIEGALTMQMQYPHFPVTSAELGAGISFETLVEGQEIDLGFATVEPILLNHPAMNFGYRIACDGKALFFSGDHEIPYNIYNTDDADFDDYQRLVDERQHELVDFLDGVDVLIADAQYSAEEYPRYRGWGHSCHEDVLELARKARVDTVYLTHHGMTRTDDELDDIGARLCAEWQGKGISVHMAREGESIEL